jgi:hypothetical protein
MNRDKADNMPLNIKMKNIWSEFFQSKIMTTDAPEIYGGEY